MFLIDVVQVRPIADRKLSLTFADGREGVVDVDAVVGEYTGVFAPLRDPAYFSQVRVHPELGTVFWPNGADLCPDVLYAHATGQRARIENVAA